MQKPKKKGIIIFSILTYAVLAGYIGLLIFVPEFAKRADGSFLEGGALSFISNHINLILNIFSFSLPAGAYWTIILIVLAILGIIVIIFAVKVGAKQSRLITANGMVAVILSALPVTLTACGFKFYMDVLNKVAPYTGRRILFGVIGILAGAVLYIILAYILFLMCVKNAKKYPGDQEEQVEFEQVEEDIMEVLDSMTREELMALMKQAVREVLAEDGKQTDCEKPIIVQYFNGLAQDGIQAKPEQVKVVQQEVAPAPAPAPVAEAPAPAAPVEDEKAKAERIPFAERILAADKVIKDMYNEIKNAMLSYGLHSRLSNSGDTFRLHRKTYAKITMAGKGLKIYYALDAKDYADSPIPVQDVSEKQVYAEIPMAFKVKSELSRRRAIQLIADAMAKDGVEQQEEPGNTNWVKDIRALVKAQKEAEESEK